MNKLTLRQWIVPICLVTLLACAGVSPQEVPEYPTPTLQKSGTIILLGDTQRTLWVEFWREQNDSIREVIFPQILTHLPLAIVHLGDIVNWGASNSEWEYFDRISKPARDAGVGFVNVLGNHEYYGRNAIAFKKISARFPIMRRSLAEKRSWNYTVIDSIAFLVLDSNIEELTTEQIDEQSTWLDSTLKALNTNSLVRNVVLCTHHPAYTNSTVAEEVEEVQEFIRTASRVSRKFTLAASGHAHTYEHFKVTNTLDVIVTGGGGGPRQELQPAKDSLHYDTYNGGVIRNFNYCTILRNNDTLHVAMMHFNENTKTWQEGDRFDAVPIQPNK
ncbi:MAG: metallophosphoesterase [Ignavibacteria bacterium]|nr:metallophosphoesterase [Ignavibacteria bacterium]